MKHIHAGIVYTQRSKNRVFTPHGRDIAPINVKFGTGERTVPNFMFIRAEMWEYSPKTVKICNFGNIFARQGLQFLRNSQILYACIGRF